MKRQLRALVVDDLSLARARVRRLLSAHDDIEVVGEAADAASATDLVVELRPDLLMLDINLPGLSGLDLARSLSASLRPLIVFLTAHAEHALPSWQVGAVDYLLKPVGEDRLALAMDRVRAALAATRRNAAADIPPLVIRDGLQTDFVALADIDYVDVAGHYLCVHVGQRTHLLRGALADLARQIAPAGFVRVHRSVLVPTAAIVAISGRRNGDADLTLRCGAVVPMSRSYRAAIGDLGT